MKTYISGCEECGEIFESQNDSVRIYSEEEGVRLECPSCEGRLLTIQESFDKILQLKRQLEDLGYEEETFG